MGAHHKQQIHRRAVAFKQRRLAAPDVDEEAAYKSLVARFSPTAIYSETITDTDTDTQTETATRTPPPDTPTPTPTPAPSTAPTQPAAPANPVNTPNTPTPNTAPTPTPTPTPTPEQQPVERPTTQDNSPPENNIQPSPSPTPDAVTPPPAVTSPTPTLSQLSSSSAFSITSNTSSAATATPSSDTSESSSNVGGIVGGIAGAILGLIAIVFVVRFILNRRRRNEEDSAAAFNASDFRRSAILINDPPTHDDTVQRGYNPRPPSMIERKQLASPAPTFGAQYGAPGPYRNEYNDMEQYGQYQSFAPGQMMNNMSPISATSPHPMYPSVAYGQSPFSPMGSPVSEMGPGYEGGQPGFSTRQPSSLSRQPSPNGMDGYPQDDAQYATHPSQSHLGVQNDYVDLARSSVSPYQAAQYAEISKQLHTDVPAGLDTPAVNMFLNPSSDGAVPTNDSTSPFADPALPAVPAALLSGGAATAVGPALPAALLSGGAAAAAASRPSTDSVTREINEFPAPPSPAHTLRSRIDSTPPMLPEIHVGEPRVASPRAQQFPPSPSPLASSFGFPTPPAAATSFPPALLVSSAIPPTAPAVPAAIVPAPAAIAPAAPAATMLEAAAAAAPVARAPAAEEKKRPDTIYDDDDVYAGI
ncbi:hypothetical protein DXG03_001618 [Asterophora parasitica]|uniref:Uncharacterized protein n=1 Tax=Asterophora parasitica TaxID=117018 RepID=A0A9P7K949_9AGAR|nr:hypothetical protein DXG03_001618 [Asterophora parasitica]